MNDARQAPTAPPGLGEYNPPFCWPRPALLAVLEAAEEIDPPADPVRSTQGGLRLALSTMRLRDFGKPDTATQVLIDAPSGGDINENAQAVRRRIVDPRQVMGSFPSLIMAADQLRMTAMEVPSWREQRS